MFKCRIASIGMNTLQDPDTLHVFRHAVFRIIMRKSANSATKKYLWETSLGYVSKNPNLKLSGTKYVSVLM